MPRLKTKCDDCKIAYPVRLVSEFRSNLGNAMLCGICALQRSNEMHEELRTTFDGPIAESLRQAAVRFRKRYGKKPAKKPAKKWKVGGRRVERIVIP